MLQPCVAYKTEKDNLLETDILNLKSIALCNSQLEGIKKFSEEQKKLYEKK